MEYDPYSLTLEPITDFKHALTLEPDWDWNLGNQNSLAAYLQTKITKPDNHYFWILTNNQPAGFIGLNIHPDHQQWQSIIFLNKPNRGTGLNAAIHKTLTEAFTHTGTTLIASIDETNIHSINSARNLGHNGQKVWEPKLNRHARLYILTEETFPTSLQTSQQIINTITDLNLTEPN